MARSYFSRMVHGGEGDRLTPLRPVANLWKSAQIGGTGDEARSAFEASRQGTLTAMPPADRSRALTPEPMREAPGSITSARPTRRIRVGNSAKFVNETQVHGKTPHTAKFAAADETQPSKADTETGAVKPITATPRQAAALSPQALDMLQPKPSPGSDRRIQQQAAHETAARRGATHQGESANAITPAAHRPFPLPQPGRDPAHRREQQAQEHERSAERNTIQIGRIEVQIVPPPPAVQRPLPAASPKGRLARGYALWPSW